MIPSKKIIDPSELRIGNKLTVAHETNSPIVTVTGITVNAAWVEERQFPQKYDLLLPIKLTPELLVKCGFEETKMPITGEDGYALKSDNYFIGFVQIEGFKFSLHNPHFNRVVMHLHDLQNLYHSLTGEELKFKP